MSTEEVGVRGDGARELEKEPAAAAQDSPRQNRFSEPGVTRTAPASADSKLESVEPKDAINEIERGPERSRSSSPETIVLDKASRERLAARRHADRLAAEAATGGAYKEGTLSERFITALDRRLEKSQLAELGWRDREDLQDVMQDLRKLAVVDHLRASTLWSKYRPDDQDRPAFLDVPEQMAATSGTSRENRTGQPDTEKEEERKEFVTPAALQKRFLQAANRYYFRNDANELAFEDRGRQLVTKHDDPVVALSMVELAEAKGWQTLHIKGSEDFKREVWLHASLKGMDVQGFRPRDVDRKKLEELQAELQSTPVARNKVERADPIAGKSEMAADVSPSGSTTKEAVVDENQRTLSQPQRIVIDAIKAVMRDRGDSEQAVELASSIAAERFQTNRVYVGKIIDHREAPYENDPKNETNYFVKLETPNGERVVWGVDLQRAIEEGGAQVGDQVAVAYQGRQQVTVRVKDRDKDGKVTGESSIVTNRNTWDVRKLETLREEAAERLKAVAETSDRAPVVPIYDRGAASTIQRPDVAVERSRIGERAR